MPQYLSPGVYVEEVPSAVKPIAGVSTSTAGFIGIVAEVLAVPPTFSRRTQKITTADGSTQSFDLDAYPVVTTPDTYEVRVGNQQVAAGLNNKNAEKKSQVNLFEAPPKGAVITVEYTTDARRGVELGDASKTKFTLPTDGNAVVPCSQRSFRGVELKLQIARFARRKAKSEVDAVGFVERLFVLAPQAHLQAAACAAALLDVEMED